MARLGWVGRGEEHNVFLALAVKVDGSAPSARDFHCFWVRRGVPWLAVARLGRHGRGRDFGHDIHSCSARLGWPRRGPVWQGMVRQGFPNMAFTVSRHGLVGLGVPRLGRAWRGEDFIIVVRLGMPRLGKAWMGKARRGIYCCSRLWGRDGQGLVRSGQAR